MSLARRRCARVSSAAAESSSDASPWASLHEDLIPLIGWRVLETGDLLDYVRLRAVCRQWRSATPSPRGRGVLDARFHPRRWMMLPEGHCLHPGHPDLAGQARFLNLDTGTLVRVWIPLLGDHCAIDSVEGLLLLLRDPDQEGAVRLVNPFTGDVTELPPLGPLLPQLYPLLFSCPAAYRIRRLAIIVSASVSFNAAGTMTGMLALHEVRRVAFATAMDRQWTLSGWECPRGYPPFSFQGKLYMLQTPSSCGEKIHQVLQVDPPVLQDRTAAGYVLQQPKVIATIPAHKLVYPYGLVECGSEILVLCGHNHLFRLEEVLVCKLADLVLQRFIPIEDIGGNTLFLNERTISVSSKILHTVKGANVVYPCSGPRYLGQYNLSSGSLSPAVDSCSLYGRAPGPSNLVHYIFSCCIRNQWSRGILFRKEAPSWSVQDEEQVQ